MVTQKFAIIRNSQHGEITSKLREINIYIKVLLHNTQYKPLIYNITPRITICLILSYTKFIQNYRSISSPIYIHCIQYYIIISIIITSSNTEMAERQPKNNECRICNYYYGYQSLCDDCYYWYHPKCVGLKAKEVKALGDDDWICPECLKEREVRANQQVAQPQVEQAPIREGNMAQSPSNTEYSNESGQVEGIIRPQENRANANSPKAGPSNTSPLHDRTNSTQVIEEDDEDETDEGEDEEGEDTDDEGYAEIEEIRAYKVLASGRRFLVAFKKTKSRPAKLEWVREKDCNGCVTLVKKFCKEKGIPMTSIKYKPGLGSADPETVNKRNFARLEEAVRMARTYGQKNSIQPQPFEKLTDQDGLYLLQLGEHCYTILYYAGDKILYIADGENLIFKSEKTQELVEIELDDSEIVIRKVIVKGQNQKNQCASSAAAIALEFQRLYPSKKIPREIVISGQRKERIASVLHKEPDQKLQKWKPVLDRQWKVRCSNCDKEFNTKNKGALNLHRC